ncbi:nucleoside recognition domain-containing protein [Thioalkalivibrio sulfidiphilus HL-EbGr7]|uniref:Nucleoside recognition domain-containing protein n=1 Tax=Thioalkalivibrio sulfidiphilus (strain HL-EbGR7) TaxID=396588 RepID=B8GPI0_THISH|nr:nucleoside recognition domain-containing protein [Thioalkalivibrio sulfidiphilus]ACL72147.1 nucleoside recognition domain-containing protein [Thioalkalivibrio sulfidiphilus HL-EbGr7]
MNIIFFALVAIAFASAAWHQLRWDGAGEAPMAQLTSGVINAAGGAVELAIALIGVMTLFLGLIKVAEAGGLLAILARLIRPLMVRLFPDVPPNHPAMGAMILNLSANMMGLGNAATPFGIRAMQALNQLNTRPGVASDSMVLFLAINTSSVTLLPTGVIAIRAAAGSSDPAAILPTTLFATLCATVAGISAAFLYRRFAPLPPLPAAPAAEQETPSTPDQALPESTDDTPLAEDDGRAYPAWVSGLALLGFVALIPLSVLYGQAIAPWIIPSLVMGFLAFGLLRGVRIYEVFVEGAKDGFQVAVRIIPYLVAILVAVGMLRASGALGAFVALLGPITGPLGLPAEALPMALLRPLSGSGAYGVMASIINDPAIGPDSYVGLLVTTLQGSTETTFYVLAVYFGAVGIRRLRHALPAALTADLVAVIAAVFAVSFLFGQAVM